MPESFHLLRNNSEVSSASGLRLLRDRGQLVDVSLVCEDGHSASAHKVVLASHSARFRQLFTLTSAPAASLHCVLLTGVKGPDLDDILDFIYQGEVKIGQSRLKHFLNVAKLLHIDSLVPEGEEEELPRTRSSSKPSSSNQDTPPVKIPISKNINHSPVKKKSEDYMIKNEVDFQDNEDTSNIDDPFGEDVADDDYQDPNYEYDNDNVNDDDGGDEDYTENSSPSKKSNGVADSPGKKILKTLRFEQSRKYANSIGFQDKDEQEDKAILIENIKLLGLTALSKQVFKNPKQKRAFKTVMSCPTLKLPCPVELMSHAQLVYWLQKEILRDIIEQGKTPRLRIFWGEDSCHPKCWPDEVWPWHLVTNVVHKQTKKPEHVNAIETFKLAVRNRLREKGIDPETYISDAYTEEEDRRKRTNRGMKVHEPNLY